jgi:hypothetical protein
MDAVNRREKNRVVTKDFPVSRNFARSPKIGETAVQHGFCANAGQVYTHGVTFTQYPAKPHQGRDRAHIHPLIICALCMWNGQFPNGL